MDKCGGNIVPCERQQFTDAQPGVSSQQDFHIEPIPVPFFGIGKYLVDFINGENLYFLLCHLGTFYGAYRVLGQDVQSYGFFDGHVKKLVDLFDIRCRNFSI